MTNMKGTKRRLIGLIMSLLLSLLLMATTAYAWFALTTVNTVQGINLQVETAPGIQVSTDGRGYYANISIEREDVILADVTPLLDDQGDWLDAYTTASGILSYPFTDSIGENVIGSANQATPIASESLWYTQDLYFKSDVAMNIFFSGLSLTSTHTSGTEVATAPEDIPQNTFGTHPAFAQGDVIDALAKYAIRIAVFSWQYDENIVIDEPNGITDKYTNPTLLAIIDPLQNEAEDWSQTNLDGLTMAHYLYNSYSLMSSEQLSSADVQEANGVIEYGTATEEQRQVCTTALDHNNNYTAKITVSLWLEGKDGSCFNSVLRDLILAGFSFRGTMLVEPPQEP